MRDIRNISIDWKNLGKFQQTKSTFSKQQEVYSNLGQVEQLYSILGKFKQLHLIWVIAYTMASIKFGYTLKHSGKCF